LRRHLLHQLGPEQPQIDAARKEIGQGGGGERRADALHKDIQAQHDAQQGLTQHALRDGEIGQDGQEETGDHAGPVPRFERGPGTDLRQEASHAKAQLDGQDDTVDADRIALCPGESHGSIIHTSARTISVARGGRGTRATLMPFVPRGRLDRGPARPAGQSRPKRRRDVLRAMGLHRQRGQPCHRFLCSPPTGTVAFHR